MGAKQGHGVGEASKRSGIAAALTASWFVDANQPGISQKITLGGGG